MNGLGFLFSCMISLGCNNFINNIRDINSNVAIASNVDKEAIDKIKDTTYDYIEPNKKIGEALENRNICSKVLWRKLNGKGDLILYRCYLTNYEKLFKYNIERLIKEGTYQNLNGVKIPKLLKQDIIFNVREGKVIPVHCEFKYNLDFRQTAILHPYCFMLGYDSDYTESWDDIVNSVMMKQISFSLN